MIALEIFQKRCIVEQVPDGEVGCITTFIPPCKACFGGGEHIAREFCRYIELCNRRGVTPSRRRRDTFTLTSVLHL